MSLTSASNTDKNQYTLEIAVGPEDFKSALDKAFRKNAPKIKVPGFRPGKAPKAMIERYYGEGVFFEDAINATYGEAYDAAVEEADINPVDRPQVEIGEISKESGYTFTAVVTVKPEVQLSGYKGVAVDQIVSQVSQEELMGEIDKLRERNARIITVSDRPAGLGDTAVIDFEGAVDGVPFPGGKGEGHPLTLGSGQFIPGFEEQVVGKRTGDEFDVNVTFPTEYHAEDLAGKAAVFKVKLQEIKTSELPEADDEFAKDVSEFDTLEELKADLGQKMQEKRDADSEAALENSLIGAVVEKLEADIPQVMFDRQVDELIHGFAGRLQSQGLDMDTYLKYTGMEPESFRKTFIVQAERQVKASLALEKIAELEAIAIPPEELEGEWAKMAEAYGIEADKVKTFVPEKELIQDLKARKAIECIRTHAKITQKSAADVEKTEKAKEEEKGKAEKAEE